MNNFFLIITSGAGGEESHDFAGMLYKMYAGFLRSKGCDLEEWYKIAGNNKTGFRQVTLRVSGFENPESMISEAGTHRLVRLSPFDSTNRRHTSFASVDVIISVPDIEIPESEIRVLRFESAEKATVRAIHTLTGIVSTCAGDTLPEAYKRVRRLLGAITQQTNKTPASERQIRSYVLHPYQMVKDHRTDYETSQTAKVLDGDLDGFIEAYAHSFKHAAQPGAEGV